MRLEAFAGRLRGCRNIVFFTGAGIISREPTPLDDLADFTYHGGIGDFF